jgi:hypothetical protein
MREDVLNADFELHEEQIRSFADQYWRYQQSAANSPVRPFGRPCSTLVMERFGESYSLRRTSVRRFEHAWVVCPGLGLNG